MYCSTASCSLVILFLPPESLCPLYRRICLFFFCLELTRRASPLVFFLLLFISCYGVCFQYVYCLHTRTRTCTHTAASSCCLSICSPVFTSILAWSALPTNQDVPLTNRPILSLLTLPNLSNKLHSPSVVSIATRYAWSGRWWRGFRRRHNR